MGPHTNTDLNITKNILYIRNPPEPLEMDVSAKKKKLDPEAACATGLAIHYYIQEYKTVAS